MSDKTQSASTQENPNKSQGVDGDYKPKEHGGLKLDGTPDKVSLL